MLKIVIVSKHIKKNKRKTVDKMHMESHYNVYNQEIKRWGDYMN